MSSDKCVSCSSIVRQRQEALCCDECNRWQHRLCKSGISRDVYKKMVKGEIEKEWLCCLCQPEPVSEEMCTTTTPLPTETPTTTVAAAPVLIQSNEETTTPDVSINFDNEDYGNFDIDLDYAIPQAINEVSLVDEPIADVTAADHQLTFNLVQTASRKCRDSLVDSSGYTYNVKRNAKNGRDWQCVYRGSGTSSCPATVKERDGEFTFGKREHNHQSAPGTMTAKIIRAKVKQEATSNVFVSAGNIVERAMAAHADADQPEFSRPKISNLVRVANRARETLRPKEPQSIDFEIAANFIPDGFLREDISKDGQRHLIFATNDQLNLLADTLTWYVDGTFKIVRPPFIQMFSIHGFLRCEDTLKQVPLVFCFMSRRQTSDYIKVFQSILKLLPRRAAVQTVVADFEKATWAALRQTIPGIHLQGCNFHWNQAVWRKVQELGLQKHYCEKGSVYQYVRLLMALAFIPVEHVPTTFQYMFDRAQSTSPALLQLATYFRDSWVMNATFPVQSWNVFMVPIRTNNDCEGWHRRINNAARDGNPPFYVIVPQLHQEALKLPIQRQMVSEGTLSRYQRKSTRCVQHKYYSLWDAYRKKDLSTSQLMKAVARINGPIA